MSDSAEQPENAHHTGGCLCGKVRYVITGASIRVGLCHCRICQKATGGAFYAKAVFSKAAVRIEGDTAAYHSSTDLLRRFCARCGSPLFAERPSKPDLIAVALGSLDDPNGFTPTTHDWTSRKVAWLTLADGLPQHPEAPV